jgi:hypothetical protein
MDRFFCVAQVYQARKYYLKTLTMNQEINIVDAKHMGGYGIRLKFDDGSSQDVDFQSFLEAALHPQIREFLKMDNFMRFRIEYGELIWGDYDLCFPVADLHKNQIFPKQSKMLAA